MRWFLSLMIVLVAVLPSQSMAQEIAKRPNILLAISDDHSWPHAGAYGDTGVKTPAFDRVAKAGAMFHTCLAGSPGCSPSRATFSTTMSKSSGSTATSPAS